MFGQCCVQGATLRGVEALPVDVEVVVSPGLPGFLVVGMPDAAIQESRERVRAALRASGFAMPSEKVVVNLAPGALRKTGSGFDLPIAVGLLAATGQVDRLFVEGRLFVGELSLEGAVRPAAGSLAYALCARELGCALVSAPSDDHVAVEGVRQTTLRSLGGLRVGEFEPARTGMLRRQEGMPDFSDVAGHEAAKRALQIAAAGNHGVLMSGPPGSGKSMLASRLPSILPPLEEDEALETALVHSVAGESMAAVLAGNRPFRSPHHSASLAGLVGGGSPPRPGEISLAHNGVLFLDELPEFSKEALETLRQPLEDGRVQISRVSGTAVFPARFMLVCAMNPCKCGWYGYSDRCRCSPQAVEKYLSRLSGPLLDRIDLFVEVPPLDFDALSRRTPAEPSAAIKARVDGARAVQAARFGPGGPACNDQMGPAELSRFCALDDACRAVMKGAFDRMGLTARSYDRILRVARTIADLDGAKAVAVEHLAEALQYRPPEYLRR